jgi:CHAD domain-containing protein/CYTH domain-containing protein
VDSRAGRAGTAGDSLRVARPADTLSDSGANREFAVPLPDYLLDLPAEEAGRLIALSLLDAAAAARPRLHDPQDPEALHDFRVALRRLRTCLKAYRPQLEGSVSRRSRRRLRDLAEATRESRDLEVHLQWARGQEAELGARQVPGLRWHVERLENRQRKANRELSRAVEKRYGRLERKLRAQLQVYRLEIERDPARRRYLAAAVVGGLIQHLGGDLESRLGAVHSAADQRKAHLARIAAKRLRYVLEPIAGEEEGIQPLVAKLQQLQDDLGEFHDSNILVAELGQSMRAAGVAHSDRLRHQLAQPGDHNGNAAIAGDDPRPGLVALSRRLRERANRSFSTIRADWLDGRADKFFQDVEETGKRVAGRPATVAEIERKYLLHTVPATARQMPSMEIEQGWLPGTRVVERLRRVSSDGDPVLYRTVKSGAGLVRLELEEETSRELFENIWPLTEGRRVLKRRHLVPDEGLTWEIDQFLDRDLVLAEVELPSRDTAVEVPDWLQPYVVREVTGEAEFSNRYLAR